MEQIPVIGRREDGSTVWYTGRAGESFVSPNPKEAFLFDSVELARNRAAWMNGYTALHGVRFVACVGDLRELTGVRG